MSTSKLQRYLGKKLDTTFPWKTNSGNQPQDRKSLKGGFLFMTVYLLHFDTKLSHAQHYIGWTDKPSNVTRRVKHHQAGDGARILQVCNERGIGYQVVRTWPEGDKTLERRLKNCKKPSRFCPVCHGDKALKNMLPENLPAVVEPVTCYPVDPEIPF
jgi:predicted GIY-YIG superfamily endonuclease